MAVGFDNVASANTTTSGAASLTWSHNVAASANLLLVVASADNINTAPSASWYTCTAGGVSMSQAASSPVNNANQAGLFVFSLASPPTGASVSIVVTNAGGTNTNNTDALIGGSLSFTGAGTLGTPVTVVSGSGTTLTLTPTGVASTSMVAAFGNAGDNMPSASPGTSEFTQNVLGSGGGPDGNCAGAINTGTGSVSVTWGGFVSGDTHSGWAVEITASNVVTPAPLVAGMRSTALTVPMRAGWQNAGHSR